MLNFNGNFSDHDYETLANRGLLFGDAVFETVRILDGKVLFLEDHYFRLMSAMRIVRMSIPMKFTMEFFESELLETARQNSAGKAGRARMTVFRNNGGLYKPETNSVSYVISASDIEHPLYKIGKTPYEVELYKDFYVSRQLLSTIKTTNKIIHVTAAIFAEENAYDNCLLVNDAKNVIEGINGNLFMLMDGKLTTPPVSEGCLNGIMRRQIIALAKKIEGLEVIEEPISPFDLQKADELFLTNVISGIQPITKYRKKEYVTALAEDLLLRLNAQLRLG